MTAIVFHSGIPAGLEISTGGQRYRFLGLAEHTRADGTETNLAQWETKCADCAEWFVTKSPHNQGPGSRRCEKHRQPGKRVRPTTPTHQPEEN